MTSADRPWGPAHWDAKYAGDDLLWSAEANRFVVAEVEGLATGTALDLACGEGRNAVWLAERGWSVTAVDFSPVGLAKAKQLASARGVEIELVEADACTWRPAPGGYELVVVAYLQLGPNDRGAALGTAATSVAPGGTLVLVAHDADNLISGFGGPQDPAVLYRAGEAAELLAAYGLEVCKAVQVRRPVETPDGTRDAIDLLVRAVRPAGDDPA